MRSTKNIVLVTNATFNDIKLMLPIKSHSPDVISATIKMVSKSGQIRSAQLQPQ